MLLILANIPQPVDHPLLPKPTTNVLRCHLRSHPRGFSVGRHLRFDPDDVRAWVDSRRSEAAA
ncbi:hypothetical protein B9W61_20355 [Streptomyces sp. CS057]|nr:hypothetical protein B9W61_20355 [Streptomyces sp. CS057]